MASALQISSQYNRIALCPLFPAFPNLRKPNKVLNSGTSNSNKKFEVRALKEKTTEEVKSAEEITKKFGLEAGLWKIFSSKEDGDEEKKDKKSKGDQAKELLAKYGGAYLATSITLSLISFGLCYALINSGVDVQSLLQKVHFFQHKLAIKFGLNELLEKEERDIMCSCTSKVCGLAAMLLRFFRNVGWFMLDPPKECLLAPLRCGMVVYAARPACRVHFGFPKVVHFLRIATNLKSPSNIVWQSMIIEIISLMVTQL